MRRGQRQNPLDTNEEVDENFWARAAADRAEGDQQLRQLGTYSLTKLVWIVLMTDGDGEPIPFETQFFHDDGDDGDGGDFGFSGDSPAGIVPDFEEEDEDLWAGMEGQQVRKARPENVHFAKKAKRVDVKRLKDEIWSGLKTLVPEQNHDSETSEEVS
jgi:condensin complex subunit 2